MLGDKIIIKKQHKDAARIIGKKILHSIRNFQNKLIVTISGEPGSGKSETATALSEFLNQNSISNSILRQDDYFVYPPKTNNFMRREDKNWRAGRSCKSLQEWRALYRKAADRVWLKYQSEHKF